MRNSMLVPFDSGSRPRKRQSDRIRAKRPYGPDLHYTERQTPRMMEWRAFETLHTLCTPNIMAFEHCDCFAFSASGRFRGPVSTLLSGRPAHTSAQAAARHLHGDGARDR